MKLAFIGFGDLGHYVRDTVSEVHQVTEEIYFDDELAKSGAPRAFAFNEHAREDFADYTFYVCIGYRHLRLRGEIVERLVGLGRKVPHFVHPSSWVHPSVKLGPGAWIYPGCSIDRGTVIGHATWISNGDVIPHDCLIGSACWFGASVTLSGRVTVGNETFIGSGTTVSNHIQIGSKVTIGLSTAVTKNIADGISVIGNPMKILERPIKLV